MTATKPLGEIDVNQITQMVEFMSSTSNLRISSIGADWVQDNVFPGNAVKTGMKALYIIPGNLPDRYWVHSYLAQPRIPRTDDCLGAICHLQFAENIRDVIAHCFEAENQLFSNLLICMSLSDQGQNL